MLPVVLILPVEVKLVNVPTEVILGCAAVVKVPIKLVAVKLLIPFKFKDASTVKTFDAVAVPNVKLVKTVLISEPLILNLLL